jgi:hypothetical protein
MKEVKILCRLADYRRVINALSKYGDLLCWSAKKVVAISPRGAGSGIDAVTRMRVELLAPEQILHPILAWLSRELTTGLLDVRTTEITHPSTEERKKVVGLA